MTVISAVLGFAARHRRVRPAGGDPTAGIEPYAEKRHRERFSLTQLSQLGEAIREAEANGALNPSALLAIRLLALTGMRRSEVTGHMQNVRRNETAGLRWADVDVESRTVRLRDSKTGARTVSLGLAAVELLVTARPASPEDYVCRGKRAGSPFVGIDKVRCALYGAAGKCGARGDARPQPRGLDGRYNGIRESAHR
jgi:integrase